MMETVFAISGVVLLWPLACGQKAVVLRLVGLEIAQALPNEHFEVAAWAI